MFNTYQAPFKSLFPNNFLSKYCWVTICIIMHTSLIFYFIKFIYKYDFIPLLNVQHFVCFLKFNLHPATVGNSHTRDFTFKLPPCPVISLY